MVGKVVLRGRRKLIVSILITLFLSVSFLVNAQSGPPYPAYWINPLRVVASGSILIKNVGPNTWGGGAISSNILQPNTDGWMEFTGATGAHYIVGLASDNKIDSDRFSHAFFLDQAANSYAIYEGATIIGMGGWQVGDVFAIAREIIQLTVVMWPGKNGTTNTTAEL